MRRLLFVVAVAAKAFNGAWETAAGTLVLIGGSGWLSASFYRLAANELLEDPRDRAIDLAGRVLSGASADAVRFAVAYLLLHGMLNIFLSVQLLRRRLWAFPVAIAINLLAMAYQVHRIALHHSATLAVVTLLDAVFIYFAWQEYRRLQREPAAA